MMTKKEIIGFTKTALALIPIQLCIFGGYELFCNFAIEYNYPDWIGTLFGLIFFSIIITGLVHGRKGGQYMAMEYWTIVEALETKKTFGMILEDFNMKEANILRLQLQDLKNIKSTVVKLEDDSIIIQCVRV